MPERVPDINLLPKFKRGETRLYILFIVLLIVTIISYLIIGYFYFSTRGKLSDVTKEYEQLEEEAEVLRTQVAQLETDDYDLERSITFVENHELQTSYVIEELIDLLPDDSYLIDYSYSSDETGIVTHFETLDTLSDYTSKLLNSNYFNGTKLSNINMFYLDDEGSFDEFETIPRYEANYTIDINHHHVKEVEKEDE